VLFNWSNNFYLEIFLLRCCNYESFSSKFLLELQLTSSDLKSSGKRNIRNEFVGT
jgi:hypothetical protein